MRFILVVLGVLVFLGGAVWALQGQGYLQGSFMSNNPTWLWIGIATAIVGIGILVWGFRSRATPKKM